LLVQCQVCLRQKIDRSVSPLVLRCPCLPVMARNDYDKTIQETEAAYLKILESSQTLLTVLKRESMGLTKKKSTQSSAGDGKHEK